MNKSQQRVQDVLNLFNNSDINLGFRRLLDCVIDTQDMQLYQEAIALTEYKENNPDQIDTIKNKAQELLEKINHISITESSTSQDIITAKDITKGYGNQKFKLGPVSITIKKGEVYGLVGENGNGKTTLLRILAHEISHDTGEIIYHFQNINKDPYYLCTKLVYIPQRTAVWYGSLKDNLKFVLTNYGYPPQENEIRVLIMIARLGLWKYKDLKWSQLSSGYKMRFELARTLLRKPELLLLDEPLANLDVLAQQTILEDLKYIANSINNPIALILSSQQLYEVEKISDKVIFLKNGQYKDNQTTNDENIKTQLIVEIESKNTREEILDTLNNLSLDKMNYNGGQYIAYFDTETKFHQVMNTLGQSHLDITYIRNISSSTRRFFVN